MEDRIEIAPDVSSLLSLPSSSQSVLLAREPPTEREKEPRADASLLGPPLKKLLGLVSCVTPGVSVASWTKSRPFNGRSLTCCAVITWPSVASLVCTSTAVPETCTLVCAEAGDSLNSSSPSLATRIQT